MRRSAVAVVPVVAALVFVACSGNDTGNSRSPITAPAERASTILPATGCDWEAMESAGHAYFSQRNDAAFTTLELMEAARKANNPALAKEYGFTLLREVASKRLTTGTVASQTAAGAAFVIDVLRCTTYMFPPTANPDVPQKFLDNLVLILSQGIFEIRGGTGDATISAAAYLSVGGVKTLGAPVWGVQAYGDPAAPTFTWPTNGHFVVYGYPILDQNVVISPATNINTNGPGTYNSFELGTIPDGHPKTGLLVGVCFPSVTGTLAANRLIHQDNQLFDNTPPTLLCQTPLAALEPASWYARALSLAGSLFTPRTATAMQGSDAFIGGLPDGWSPHSTAQIVGTSVGLAYTTQPVNTSVGVTVPVVVRAVTNGLGVPGVAVTISITNNHGVPAGATIVGGDPTVHTNSQGYASFNIAVNKPGGYLFTASGEMSAVVGTNFVISNQIQVKLH
jgi:hypothetical protein